MATKLFTELTSELSAKNKAELMTVIHEIDHDYKEANLGAHALLDKMMLDWQDGVSPIDIEKAHSDARKFIAKVFNMYTSMGNKAMILFQDKDEQCRLKVVTDCCLCFDEVVGGPKDAKSGGDSKAESRIRKQIRKQIRNRTKK